MNKVLTLLTLAVATSFSVNAAETEQVNHRPAQGWYVGADGVFAEVTANGDNGGKDVTHDLDTGVGVHVGYDLKFTQSFVTGVELEFINYGSITMGQTKAVTSNGGQVIADVDLTFTSMNLNVRPKYYIADSGFYVGGLLGFGSSKLELELTKSGYQSHSVDDETGTAFNYGIEAGYEFESAWMLYAGMRRATTELDGTDFDIDASYVGVRCKF